MLSDQDILHAINIGELTISPLADNAVQPASVDLCLGPYLTTVDGNTTHKIPHTMLPGEFLLASTVEEVHLSPSLAARVEGKSSIGRLGLAVHVTAGFIDPGFRGQITLELLNVSGRPIELRDRMRISQLSITRLSSPAVRPYGTPSLRSHYQGQSGPTPSWRAA